MDWLAPVLALEHDAGFWWAGGEAVFPADVHKLYDRELDKYPDSWGVMVAIGPDTPTGSVAEMLQALRKRNIVDVFFTVGVPWETPPQPRSATSLPDYDKRIGGPNGRRSRVSQIRREEIESLNATCDGMRDAFIRDTGWGEYLDELPPKLAKAYVDCDCKAEADRLEFFYYVFAMGPKIHESRPELYPAILSEDGYKMQFQPDESWGQTVGKLPAPRDGFRLRVHLAPIDAAQ